VVDDATVGNIAWDSSSLNNVKVSDNVRAWAILPNNGLIDTSHYLKATNFGFTIPSGATINGIVVEIEKLLNQGDLTVLDNAVRIVKGGTIGSTDRSNGSAWPQVEAYVTHGGTTDLWGETLTDTDINSASFGVAISAKEGATTSYGQPFIDHIRITVYYTN